MISRISLENFKGFGLLKNMNVRPITILCGPNGCGKSSLVQSILLMKQSLENHNPNQTVLLNGRLADLGKFEDIVFRKDSDKVISFRFSFDIDKTFLHNMAVMNGIMIDEMMPEEGIGDPKADCRVHFKISLKVTSDGIHYLRPILVNYYSLRFESIKPNGKVIPGGSFEMSFVKEDTYSVKWKDVKFASRVMGATEEVSDGELFARIGFANISPRLLVTDVPSRFIDLSILSEAGDVIKAVFNTYNYIGSLREKPLRRYIYEDATVEIGVRGENAAYICLTEQNSRLDSHYFYDKERETFILKKNIRLGESLQEWLNIMDIKNFSTEMINEIIYLNLDSGLTGQTRVNIADAGSVVNQVFPILLEGLRMPKQHTLILDQPELHLYPNLQMRMADFFVALALSGKQVIAETHSNHLINRLVRRIVDDQTHRLRDLIGICFMKPSENGMVFEEVKIDETRGILNSPEGFFDEIESEQQRIMRAGLDKRRKMRERKKS